MRQAFVFRAGCLDSQLRYVACRLRCCLPQGLSVEMRGAADSKMAPGALAHRFLQPATLGGTAHLEAFLIPKTEMGKISSSFWHWGSGASAWVVQVSGRGHRQPGGTCRSGKSLTPLPCETCQFERAKKG